MRMQWEAMALAMPEVDGHPNRRGFRGVLTMANAPSDRAPSGARGHKVMLTAQATERALGSLLGMGVDYAPELDRHDAQRKVGIITSAELRPAPGKIHRLDVAVWVATDFKFTGAAVLLREKAAYQNTNVELAE